MKFPGLLAGKFSVSDTQQVQFSQGNLQAVVGSGYAPDYYYASSWKFAEHQWDYLGYTGNNNHFGTGYSVDLFGWVGTNADNNTFGYGLCTSTDDNDYGKPNNTLKSDWGTVIITNGGNTPNYGWRTLTKDEWVYLFARTTTSGICYAKATVNGKSGVILLPDDWSASYHALASANTANADFTSNPITAAEWTSDFEAHGAVFLPAAGVVAARLMGVATTGRVRPRQRSRPTKYISTFLICYRPLVPDATTDVPSGWFEMRSSPSCVPSVASGRAERDRLMDRSCEYPLLSRRGSLFINKCTRGERANVNVCRRKSICFSIISYNNP